MIPEGLVLIAPIEPMPDGSLYDPFNCPLHITVVPWYKLPENTDLDSVLSKVSEASSPIIAQVGRRESFGPNQDVAVNVIDNPVELEKLHRALFQSLGLTQTDLISPYHGDDYRPHITRFDQEGRAKEQGELVNVDSVTLVRVHDQDTVIVAKTYRLGLAT